MELQVPSNSDCEWKKAFHVVVHFTWWSNCKAMKMTNSLRCCCFGWQNPKPQWEWIKAWMVVDFTWSNAEKWIWKKPWTMLFWMIKSQSIIEWKKACMLSFRVINFWEKGKRNEKSLEFWLFILTWSKCKTMKMK